MGGEIKAMAENEKNEGTQEEQKASAQRKDSAKVLSGQEARVAEDSDARPKLSEEEANASESEEKDYRKLATERYRVGNADQLTDEALAIEVERRIKADEVFARQEEYEEALRAYAERSQGGAS